MKQLTFTFFLSLFIINTYATHVVGGDISVTQKGANLFDIKVRVFRDCKPGNATMPMSVNLGIYQKGTNAQVSNITIARNTLKQITLGDSCFTPENLCIEEGVFIQTNVNIPNFANGYYLQTELYARNGIITNIVNPGGTGMSFFAEIPNPAILNGNSTPDFGEYPFDGYFCIGFEKQLDFSLTDPNGDSLVYSLIDPLNSVGTGNLTNPGPYQPVVWQNPYSLNNVCGGTPPMSINPTTGIVTAKPSNIGVYVFAIRVEEYRNGVKIGEVRRDVQYAALNCAEIPPVIKNQNSEVDVYINHTICFDIMTEDVGGNDSVFMLISSTLPNFGSLYVPPYTSGNNYYYLDFQGNDTLWFSDLNNMNGTFQGIGKLPMRYCFTPTCKDRDSTYVIKYSSYIHGCTYSDTVESTIKINVLVSTPIFYNNLPDDASLKRDSTLCFDLMGSDPINPNLKIFIVPLGDEFDYAATFIPPKDTTKNGQNWSFYTNFLGLDTMWMQNFSNSSTINANSSVGARYCLYADCESMYQENYKPGFKIFTNACASDTVEKHFQIDIHGNDGKANEVPNVFTPNGDGVNDYFMLSGTPDICYDTMKVKIYNRWGQLVFESEEQYFQWDGKNMKGKECTAGTYFVLVEGHYGSKYHGGGQATREAIPVVKQYYLQLLR